MERETERERERESGRKQSQRYCDTQRFLVSFWNLMNQTWCLHTHAHTHTHTHTNPTLPVMTTWAYSCQNGLQRKAPKTSTYILSSFELGHPWSPVQTCQHVSPSQECQFFFLQISLCNLELRKGSRHPCIRQKRLSTSLLSVRVWLSWLGPLTSYRVTLNAAAYRDISGNSMLQTLQQQFCREHFPVSARQGPRAQSLVLK